MKPLLLSLTLGAMLLTQPACERHPASETVPGYAEKQAAKSQPSPEASSKPAADSPSYFPGSGK